MTRRLVYETDDLFFIKGFDWFSKFLLSDECAEQIRSLLKEKCGDRYIDKYIDDDSVRVDDSKGYK